MTKFLKEELIIRKIHEKDYNGDSLILGNIDPILMTKIEKSLLSGVNQNIALINMLNKDMIAADKSGVKDIIFEYFWGFVYQYIYTNPNLKQKYINSKIEDKLAFFNSLLEKPLNLDFLNKNNKYLFSIEPNEIILSRGEGDFKICLLNYQNITSLHLIQQINRVMRERPQITILTSGCGLKDTTTGIETGFVSLNHDFSYFDIQKEKYKGFKLENR